MYSWWNILSTGGPAQPSEWRDWCLAYVDALICSVRSSALAGATTPGYYKVIRLSRNFAARQLTDVSRSPVIIHSAERVSRSEWYAPNPPPAAWRSIEYAA